MPGSVWVHGDVVVMQAGILLPLSPHLLHPWPPCVPPMVMGEVMVAQAGSGRARGHLHIWPRLAVVATPLMRLESSQSWPCPWGVCAGMGTAGQRRGHGPPGHASASPSSTLPQWMKNRWRSWIRARGCRSSRRGRSSPRAGGAAVGAER